MALDEQFALPQPLPLKFRPFDKHLYSAIQDDVEARKAFHRLTTGKKAISPSWLLLSLSVEADSGARPTNWRREETWRQKWEGLRSVAQTLRKASAKMTKHLHRTEIGPAPLPIMGIDKWNKEYRSSVVAQAHLAEIPALLIAVAKLIEYFCELNKRWIRDLPQHRSDRKQAVLALLVFVKRTSGKCYFERVAALVNVGRALRGLPTVSRYSLRILWKRHGRDAEQRLYPK